MKLDFILYILVILARQQLKIYMKANELPINNFLQAPNVQFVIPVYQRNYDWTTSECKKLLNDIVAVEQEERGTHFIGSIVFIHEGTYKHIGVPIEYENAFVLEIFVIKQKPHIYLA